MLLDSTELLRYTKNKYASKDSLSFIDPVVKSSNRSMPHQNMPQRAIVKIKVCKPTALKNQLKYISQEGKGIDGDNAPIFTADGKKIEEVSKTNDNEQHFFRLIVSPENGKKVDLEKLAKDIMLSLKSELGKDLAWFGAEHHDTENPHVHIIIRGIANNKKLLISRDMIKTGIRELVRKETTNQLGWRNEKQAIFERRELHQKRVEKELVQKKEYRSMVIQSKKNIIKIKDMYEKMTNLPIKIKTAPSILTSKELYQQCRKIEKIEMRTELSTLAKLIEQRKNADQPLFINRAAQDDFIKKIEDYAGKPDERFIKLGKYKKNMSLADFERVQKVLKRDNFLEKKQITELVNGNILKITSSLSIQTANKIKTMERNH